MPEELPEAEGVHEGFHRATAQGGCDLAAEELRGGTADEHIHLFGVHHPSDKALPTRYDLYFVEEEADLLLIAVLGELAEIFLKYPVKLGSFKACEAFVIEVEVNLCFAWCSFRDAFLLDLVKEAGLTRPAHPDYGMRLPRNGGQAQVPPGRRGKVGVQGVGELLADDVSHGVLLERTLWLKPVLLKRTGLTASAAQSL
jgi:hypothetical protein